MLLGFPTPVWIMLAVEFAERLGYYAVSFSLFTYCTNMLRSGASRANAILNALYIVIPLAACGASGLADGNWGRPRTLGRFLCAYAVGLILLSISAAPVAYANFPLEPTAVSVVLFVLALMLFSTGYGGMKVCTNPMMADSVTALYHTQRRGNLSPNDEEEEPQQQDEEEDGGRRSPPRHTPPAVSLDESLSRLFRCIYWVTNCGGMIGILVAPLLRSLDPRHVTLGSSEYTTGYYYSFAFAALSVTSGLVVFLRYAEHFTRNKAAPSFVLFRLWARALVCWCAFACGYWKDEDFASRAGKDWVSYAVYSREGNSASPPFHNTTTFTAQMATRSEGSAEGDERAACDVVVVTSPDGGHGDVKESAEGTTRKESDCGAAIAVVENRASTAVGRGVGEAAYPSPFSKAVPARPPHHEITRPADNGFGSSSLSLSSSSSSPSTDYALADVTSPEWTDACRATMRVCKAFVALPVYWLLCNQFSTNIRYVATALDLPPSVPPEIFDNLNTWTILTFLALFDKVIVPHCCVRRRTPSARARIVAGFALMLLSMVWCGLVQLGINQRGVYDDDEAYVLHEGAVKLSAGWLVVPYILQGLASALVDTAVMEVAYAEAPERMKGTVMALYWVASSASGFLGLLLSPVMGPQHAALLCFVFAAALGVVTVLFAVLNPAAVAPIVLPSRAASVVVEEGGEKTEEKDAPTTSDERSVRASS